MITSYSEYVEAEKKLYDILFKIGNKTEEENEEIKSLILDLHCFKPEFYSIEQYD